jgi:hypothetical protein
MPNIEQAVKDLQDAMLVIAEIEKRQSSLLREHSERIVSIERSLARSAQLDEEIREIQKHGDERLNALIAVVDGMVRKPPPQ